MPEVQEPFAVNQLYHKRNQSNMRSIANIAIEARAHGMTYGQYVAMQYAANNPIRKK